MSAKRQHRAKTQHKSQANKPAATRYTPPAIRKAEKLTAITGGGKVTGGG